LSTQKLRLGFVICLFALLWAILPADFSVSAQTQTPTPTGGRRVNSRVLRNAVRGLQLDGTLDTHFLACWSPTSEVVGWTMAYSYSSGSVTSPGLGESLQREPNTLISLLDSYIPTVCSTNPLGGVTATSPSGRVMEPFQWIYDGTQVYFPSHYEGFSGVFYAASLPITAYGEPGRWTLSVSSPTPYTLYIDIQEPDAPFGLIDTVNGGYFVGGFPPNESIVGFILDGQGAYADGFEVVTNNRGAASAYAEAYQPYRGVFIIGERTYEFSYPLNVGPFADVANPDETIVRDINGNFLLELPEIAATVRAEYFSNNGTSIPAGDDVCNNGFGVRLSVGGQGRRADPDVNVNIRPTASTARDRLGLINDSSPFDVLDGPTCAGGLTWYRIRWNGITGYIAEAANGVYLVEPIEGSVTAGGGGSGGASGEYLCFTGQFLDQGYRTDFGINLRAGDVITIRMWSDDFDTYLRLLNPNGDEIAFNDDANGTLNSEISDFTIGFTGQFFASAGAYSDSGGGSYDLLIIVNADPNVTLVQAC